MYRNVLLRHRECVAEENMEVDPASVADCEYENDTFKHVNMLASGRTGNTQEIVIIVAKFAFLKEHLRVFKGVYLICLFLFLNYTNHSL